MEGIKPEFRDELVRLTNAEIAKHTSLLGVHVVPVMLSYKKLLPQFGYDLKEHYDWGNGSGQREEHYINPEDETQEGAFTIFLNRDGVLKTVVFVKRYGDIEVAAHAYVMSLLHEMGHVDDCEKSINFTAPPLRIGALIDAELYAHHYACSRMVENGYKSCLRAYIGMKENDAGDSSVCDIYRMAAKKFIEQSNKYRGNMAPARKKSITSL